MNWEQLKEKIYYQDGSLRDILILNATKSDWQIWVDFVTKHYKCTLVVEDTTEKGTLVDLNTLFDYWDQLHEISLNPTILIDHIAVKSYFFAEQEIENDIAPYEINSLEDHNKLIQFLTGLSKALNKKVVLTPENTPEEILITVYRGEVIIHPGL